MMICISIEYISGYTSCAQNNGGCQQICSIGGDGGGLSNGDDRGGDRGGRVGGGGGDIGTPQLKCKCYDGFQLAPDGKACSGRHELLWRVCGRIRRIEIDGYTCT